MYLVDSPPCRVKPECWTRYHEEVSVRRCVNTDAFVWKGPLGGATRDGFPPALIVTEISHGNLMTISEYEDKMECDITETPLDLGVHALQTHRGGRTHLQT